jgi:nicotinate-nucleotide--dimethylbenzimidazole phosphoribosyltransferase
LDVLAKLGGFDIAAMCGVFLGGALYRVPIIVDGFISATAAYCAWLMRPECRYAMLASHRSAERAASTLLERMGLKPIIYADMRLGEGTGAVCLIPLLDMALSLYRTGPTFADCGITSYKVEQ